MAADTYGALAMAYQTLVATRLPPTGISVGMIEGSLLNGTAQFGKRGALTLMSNTG